MRYLIDGYNLLHVMGALRDRSGPEGLEKARLHLFGLLRGALGEAAREATIVFDAAGAPPGADNQLEVRGIDVRFVTQKGAQADDVIEDLIQQHSAPRYLTVVSDDHRLQVAAKKRKAVAMKGEEFLESLERERRRRKDRLRPSEKTKVISPDETARWLVEFGEE